MEKITIMIKIFQIPLLNEYQYKVFQNTFDKRTANICLRFPTGKTSLPIVVTDDNNIALELKSKYQATQLESLPYTDYRNYFGNQSLWPSGS